MNLRRVKILSVPVTAISTISFSSVDSLSTVEREALTSAYGTWYLVPGTVQHLSLATRVPGTGIQALSTPWYKVAVTQKQ